jgi:hypothetical protein
MRKSFLFFWALLNPEYKYNYSNDGTDTISNQIFITHMDPLGLDSISVFR